MRSGLLRNWLDSGEPAELELRTDPALESSRVLMLGLLSTTIQLPTAHQSDQRRSGTCRSLDVWRKLGGVGSEVAWLI
jgi:hypothetical protein